MASRWSTLADLARGGLKAGDQVDYTALTALLRNLPDTIDYEILIRNVFREADASFYATVMKNLDPDIAARIAKGLDQRTVNAILEIAPELSTKIGRTSIDNSAFGTVLDSAGLTQNGEIFRTVQFRSYRGQNYDTLLRQFSDLPDDATAESMRATLKQRFPNLTDEQIDTFILNNMNTLKNSDEGMEAMGALGFVKQSWGNFATWTAKNWYKLGAALFLLCLMYDTENPFEALRRAVKDAGKFVRNLKEVADKAAQNASNAFDLLAWLTANPWVSIASSGACVLMALGIAASSVK